MLFNYCYIDVQCNSQLFGKVLISASSLFKEPTGAIILVIERQLWDFLDKNPNLRHFNQDLMLVEAVSEYC